MIDAITSLYMPSYPSVLVYMLQTTEYQVKPYLKWYWRTQNFRNVMVRRQLERTKAAKLLLLAIYLAALIEVLAGLVFIYLGHWHHVTGGVYFGFALIVAYPVVIAHLIALPRAIGRALIVGPNQKRQIDASEKQFKKFKGIKIAILGSYGKTSMKELLLAVLKEGKKVEATPANKNVPISHAQFINNIAGDEDILIIEYGEGRLGDIERFAKITHPTHAVITGIAPAHLDHYKNMDEISEDILSIADYLKDKNVYANNESSLLTPHIKKSFHPYDSNGALGWNVSQVKTSINGTTFNLTKGNKTLKLSTGLLGEHNIGPLSLAAALADQFGLSEEQIIDGVANTKPFEHRMNPYQLNGAWVVDDTYNGNIEGIKAGTKLLGALKAKRKWYVTPGLVDQGSDTKSIHMTIGKLIAEAKPDIVVLMKNSTTDNIVSGLKEAGYGGDIRIEPKPLDFYTNLGEFVAIGDLVMMQNDWPDNYI
ncbi:MAG TPA: Mur ligase family protein [Candidatus Saccharimonadales bacterium]|nr:Mur ligase family protein [Candidatus Saccharimonadales bacterium]